MGSITARDRNGKRVGLSLVPSPLPAAILPWLKGGLMTLVDFLGPRS